MHTAPKILIVDDEPANLATLEAFLESDGYEISFASNGIEGCRKAREILPDLILLDVMMPDMDGFSVCRLIRSDPILGRIPIVLITALDDQASRLEGLRAGADDFVTKPCQREELRARVRTIASLNRFRVIAEQQTRFRQLYELAPLAIFLADADGRVLEANPRARAMFSGILQESALHRSLGSCFNPPGAAALQRSIARALGGAEPEPCEIQLSAGSRERVLQLRVAAVPHGNVMSALLIFDDVTSEVRARESLEEKVRERTAQLEDTNQLLLSYASFVSHDLRSPITVLKGYLGLIEEGVVPINPEAASLVHQAFSAAEMMDDLVVNILQLARETHTGVGTAPPIPIDPTPIIARLAKHLQELTPGNRARFQFQALPRIAAPVLLIERVFYNLIANALKYSAGNAAPLIEIGARAVDGQPTLFVRDNGIGFAPDESGQLFRDFSRLGSAAPIEGLGLGLSLTARLVRARGGRVWAEGVPAKGATFFVQFSGGRANRELPAAVGHPAAACEQLAAALP